MTNQQSQNPKNAITVKQARELLAGMPDDAVIMVYNHDLLQLEPATDIELVGENGVAVW